MPDALVNTVVREQDAFVRDTLACALVACSEEWRGRSFALLSDPRRSGRQHAGHPLRKRADRAATEALMRAAADEDCLVAGFRSSGSLRSASRVGIADPVAAAAVAASMRTIFRARG